MRELLTASLVMSTMRLATPLVLAALGGLFSERAGVINIALEGIMLAGAFAAAAMTYATGSPWVGLLSGMAAGLLIAAIHAVACIRYQGRSSGQRDGDQHSHVRRARVSERRTVSLLGIDAAASERAADPVCADGAGGPAGAADLVRVVSDAIRPASAVGR